MYPSFLKTTKTKEFKMMLNLNVAFLKIGVFVSVGRIFGACENGTTGIYISVHLILVLHDLFCSL